jgi:hypothetical protein
MHVIGRHQIRWWSDIPISSRRSWNERVRPALRPILPGIVGPFENVGNVEPELPLISHLSGISPGEMVLHVETRAPAEIVLYPFRPQALPVGIAPTGDDQVDAIMYPVRLP